MTPIEAAALAAELLARLERIAQLDLRPVEHVATTARELTECREVLAALTDHVAAAADECLAFRLGVRA